jgi:hypothetical protein
MRRCIFGPILTARTFSRAASTTASGKRISAADRTAPGMAPSVSVVLTPRVLVADAALLLGL